jgi:hypothetical protein
MIRKMDMLDKIMKKLNKKEKAIIVELFKECQYYKEENEELIDMFVTEKCFSHIKEKIEKKYKRCSPKSVVPTADDNSSTKDI